jgi:glycine/D-amino acid oxidase-like deaminating enzyme
MAPHSVSPPPRSVGSGTTASPRVDVSLPQASPCLSYWHRTTRAFKYLNVNADATVPASSPFVIIGSGLSGALTAFSLIEAGVKGADIVILEAREAVSGASGRNAGHVRPDAFRGFQGYASLHGSEQAIKIIENEKLVFERVDEFVRKHNVQCDFNPTTTFDVCLTPEFAAYEAASFKAFQKAGGDASHVKVYQGEEARKRTRIADAVAAYEWPAGSSHPAKLAHWLLNSAINQGAKLWTHCPATQVNKGSNEQWEVQTPRGRISAEKVIHCTNAFAAALLPQLSAFVTPNKAQAHSVVPTQAFSGDKLLESTMSLRYSMHHFYSLIQRQGDGTIILGVSRANPELSAETKAQIVSFDDSSFNPEIVEDAMGRFKVIFPESNTKTRHGEGLDYSWTGIIGMTPDSVPLIGPIDDLPGQYICAGFNGHGMARIFTCAPGLVKLITGGTWADTGLPECFQYSADRLSKAAQKMKKESVW